MFAPRLLSAHNPSPMTGSGNNTYLLAGENGSAALIDAGIGESRHLDDLTAALGDSRTRLDRVLVTHGHRDHVDGVSEIARAHPAARFCKCLLPGDRPFGLDWERLEDGDEVVAGD